MDWLTIIGSISGIIAILSLVFFTGMYVTKIKTLCKVQEKCPIGNIAIKIETIWGMKDDLAASLVKIDTLWRIYIEDNLIRFSNPGGTIVIPEELKDEIRGLLNNNEYLSRINEPTLLIIHKIGTQRFAEIAKTNGTGLGQVLTEINTFIFSCCGNKENK